MWEKPCILAAMVLISKAAAARTPPAKQPFFGKGTAAWFRVESADPVATRPSGMDGIVVRTYRAVLVVKESIPSFSKPRIVLTVERAEVNTVGDPNRGVPPEIRAVTAARMRYATWFPIAKGSEFIAAFDGVPSEAKEMLPTVLWTGAPLDKAWEDHKAFYGVLSGTISASGGFASLVAKRLGSDEPPPGHLFFDLVWRYDDALNDDAGFCLAMSRFLTNRNVPFELRSDLSSRVGSKGSRSAESLNRLYSAHIKLIEEAGETKDRAIRHTASLLNSLHRLYLDDPLRAGKPLPPVERIYTFHRPGSARREQKNAHAQRRGRRGAGRLVEAVGRSRGAFLTPIADVNERPAVRYLPLLLPAEISGDFGDTIRDSLRDAG